MTTDVVLSRELKSLHQELFASRRERPSPPADAASTSGGTAAPTGQLQDAAEERRLHEELRKFVGVIAEFVQEAEKNASTHPTANMIGAMVVGILIGRLLGRR